jgi:hypothetical protein
MFMKIARGLGVAAALIAAAGLLVPAMAADYTTGDFVKRIAAEKKLAASTANAAVNALQQAGYRLPALDLDSSLTEGDVVGISNALGIRVTTSQPGAPFGEAQADGYFAAFSTELGVNIDPTSDSDDVFGTDKLGNNGNGANPLDKGKGKKKGIRTPDDPV